MIGQLPIDEIEKIKISEVDNLLEIMKSQNNQSRLETIEVLLKKKNEHDELKNSLNQERKDINALELKEKVLILRLNQQDGDYYEEEDSEISLPKYLRRQISSRNGRAWHWSLWVPDHIKRPDDEILGENIGTRNENIFPKPQKYISNSVSRNSEYYGWIVFEKADLKSLKWMPWIITDIDMKKIDNK